MAFEFLPSLQENAKFSTNCFVMCKAYTNEGGIKKTYTMVCPPVREIIHSLKLVDYLLIQADKPWYNYYPTNAPIICNMHKLLSIQQAFQLESREIAINAFGEFHRGTLGLIAESKQQRTFWKGRIIK